MRKDKAIKRNARKRIKGVIKHHAKLERKGWKTELKACKRLKHHYDKYGCNNEVWDLYVSVTNYIIELRAKLKKK